MISAPLVVVQPVWVKIGRKSRIIIIEKFCRKISYVASTTIVKLDPTIWVPLYLHSTSTIRWPLRIRALMVPPVSTHTTREQRNSLRYWHVNRAAPTGDDVSGFLYDPLSPPSSLPLLFNGISFWWDQMSGFTTVHLRLNGPPFFLVARDGGFFSGITIVVCCYWRCLSLWLFCCTAWRTFCDGKKV